MSDDFFAGCVDEADRWDHAIGWASDMWSEHDLTVEELVAALELYLLSKGIEVD